MDAGLFGANFTALERRRRAALWSYDAFAVERVAPSAGATNGGLLLQVGFHLLLCVNVHEKYHVVAKKDVHIIK